jgi:hypothetical protein
VGRTRVLRWISSPCSNSGTCHIMLQQWHLSYHAPTVAPVILLLLYLFLFFSVKVLHKFSINRNRGPLRNVNTDITIWYTILTLLSQICKSNYLFLVAVCFAQFFVLRVVFARHCFSSCPFSFAGPSSN